ncbi:hypothetical protein [Sphingobium sp.]|uniref:hypothetical protein n=1 Tax=Sphingobium sp. TaxID=1912891 RepID=UPI002615167C|nr:hypothetical protein [Sphingobium sp.]
MTGHIRNIRPARAAIAAVLALSATPLLAQTVVIPPAIPTTAPESAAPAAAAPMQAPPAATAPIFTPGEPMVQATPPIDERIAAATAAVEAEQAQPRRAARQQASSAPSAQAVAERSAPQQDRAAPIAAAPVETAAPAPLPAEAVAAATAPATATPTAADTAPVETARADNALLWAMGGGALLLLGLGGTALMRRRRPNEDHEEVMTDAAPVITPTAMAPPPTVREPVQLAVERAAMAPAGSMLEAMVAAAPSVDNPFTTRAKRLRRAKFLLAQREAAHMPHRAPQTMDAEPAPASSLASALDRSQTVYRFGSDRPRPGFLKPRTR